MSFFKKLFSSGTKDSGKTDKKTGAIAQKDLNPEHKQIVELYTQKNPTPLTSKEIVESIAEELGKKPGGVRTILSKAGVYVKQEKPTWKNNKKLALERGGLGYSYSELSETLQKDRDIAESIAKEDVFQLDSLLEKFYHDREFILKAIELQEGDDYTTREEKIGYIFNWDLCEYFKDDEELILIGWNNLNPETRVLSDLFMPNYGDPGADYSSLFKNREFMLAAINENPINFECVGPNLREASEFLEIVKADDYLDYLNRVHTELREEHHKKTLEAIKGEINEDDEVIEIP